MFYGESIERSSVAAKSVAEEARNTADGRDTDAGQVMDLTIGHVLLQTLDDLPAVDQCLKLRWCTQVSEKIAAFTDVMQAQDSLEQRIFCFALVSFGILPVRFHPGVLVLM
jgi:hypothetical protein